MRVVWTAAALRDLVEVRCVIERDDPGAAQGMAQRILDAVELLEANPRIGRPGRIPGTRELVIARSPYIIPYRIRGDGIELLRVIHGRMRWPEQL